MSDAPPPAVTSAPFPIVPVIAGLVVAALGPALWVGIYRGVGGNIWLPAVLIGVAVGLAMRFASRSSDPRQRWIAAGLTLLSCVAAYFITGLFVMSWQQPPTLGDVTRLFFNDLFAIIVIAVGCYLAYILAARNV